MKKKLLFIIASLIVSNISAQFHIDLSKTTPPDLHYLKLGHSGPPDKEIRINNLYMEERGIPQLPVMGEIHYSRINERYWRDTLLKMKASGINIIATYCIWSLHEEMEGDLSWEGNLNLRRFILLCKDLGLKVHLRFGPYCNAEIKNGGLPNWIVNNKNLIPRSNDPLYLEYTRRWYQAVYEQIKGLLWKEGGPIMALQLENEYVRPGMIISHLLTLKKMAVEIGFDVPIYSMTHWMDSEYPKGEIIPYAGFYIEAPWTASGKEEIPTSNFEYFTYNRLSDNIGTDIIKLEGEVESLNGENNDSPFFTCEIGVGTTVFYQRRAVVPEEMAGENINLRLGCGANMMGYYMYAGGSNPIGKQHTFQSSGPRVSYDYQAPVREFGTLGAVMPEVKKYNYFMNDFGTSLAPTIAYLPTSNQKRENLQWAVRTDQKIGYLFCSNYLYKHNKKDYKNVQFTIKLKDETIRMPRKKTTIKDGTYFCWPFNHQLEKIQLKYATTQPICCLQEGNNHSFFFFEDDDIPGEYLIAEQNIQHVEVQNGTLNKEKGYYFINALTPGKECTIILTQTDGKVIRLITLTEKESDHIWKGEIKGQPVVILSEAALIYESNQMTLISEQPSTELWMYTKGTFKHRSFQASSHNLQASFHAVAPLTKSEWIAPDRGNTVIRKYALHTFADVESACLRYVSPDKVSCSLNNHTIAAQEGTSYKRADITSFIQKGENVIEINAVNSQVIAEIEILLKNGERIVWKTDATWTSSEGKTPVTIIKCPQKPKAFDPQEHLAVYEIYAPAPACGNEETRMYISYKGNIANAYLNGKLVHDSFYDGTDWILSLSRLKERIDHIPLTIRLKGLKSAEDLIYFEQNVNPNECVIPSLSNVRIVQEYRFTVTDL